MSAEHFKVIVAAALADGSIDDAERSLLFETASSFGVGVGLVEGMIEEAKEGKLSGKIPKDPGERARLFSTLLAMVAADGEISKGEEKLFLRLSSHFGLNEFEAEDLLRASVTKI
ncbi:MAG: TerB family tellurite resistance protein [Planctomycetes bacterium]|nr:TerB family tellurite resistance protein [Planctomycetota bacterium]